MADITLFPARDIITMDPSRPRATHVAVRQGKILAVGDADCAAPWGDADIDTRLADAVLMPGFVEGHAHLMAGAMWTYTYVGFHDRLDPDGTLHKGMTDLDAVIDRLAASAADLPPGAPLVGWGLDPIFLPGERLSKRHLDKVDPDRPIAIMFSNFHLMCVNSKALELAEYSRQTNAEGVIKGADGSPTGELQEMAAMFPVMRRLGIDFRKLTQTPQTIRTYGEVCKRAGVTTVTDLFADMADEDLIEREDMVVTVTSGGYIKRTALADFRAQKRGGKGLSGMATKDDDVVTTLFVANTHTPLLVFTTDGMVYNLKTWRLPQGGRNAKGKPLVGILPIEHGVSIAAIMNVNRPEAEWDDLNIVFATSVGSVRRNRLSDFTNVKANGKIAMKFPEGEDIRLIGARICSPEEDDVMLVTALGRAIRFGVTEVREFKGRDSTGVRGVKLGEGDRVVSMAVLRHFEATPEERAAYLKMRRAVEGATEEPEAEDEEAVEGSISQDRYAEMSAAENLILTITERGLGKLSSSHDYPVRGRGGQGVAAFDKRLPGGPIAAAFPVEMDDQIMLATDSGQSIRCPVGGISFRSRGAGGVKVMNAAGDEKVVSVARIAEPEAPEDAGGAPEAPAPGPETGGPDGGSDGGAPDDAPDGDAA